MQDVQGDLSTVKEVTPLPASKDQSPSSVNVIYLTACPKQLTTLIHAV